MAKPKLENIVPKGRPKVKMIQSLDRQTNSLSGNPRYRVFFTDGESAMTKQDAAVNGIIGNSENVAPHKVSVYFERGQIVYVEPVPE